MKRRAKSDCKVCGGTGHKALQEFSLAYYDEKFKAVLYGECPCVNEQGERKVV